MPDRAEVIDALRESESRLAATVAAVTEGGMRQPSRLPGWTVAHVVAHLAANADSVTRRLRGMISDVVVDQYPGGREGRAAEIEERSRQDAQTLREDLAGAVATMFDVVDDMSDAAWNRLSRNVGGRQIDGDAVLGGRWQEVEIHHADLGLTYTIADWPEPFVTARLPHLLQTLPHRADPGHLLAWTAGRGPAPTLDPW